MPHRVSFESAEEGEVGEIIQRGISQFPFLPYTGPETTEPERSVVRGRRIVIKLTWEAGARYLRHECINSEQLRNTNPQGNGIGPNYETPAGIGDMVEELDLVGVQINWGPNSQDMVFICGWNTARLINMTWGSGPVPDITGDLSYFLKQFRYVVIPLSDARLITKSWLAFNNHDFAGPSIADVLRESYANTQQDPRKHLIFHVNPGRPLEAHDHANDRPIQLIGPYEQPAQANLEVMRLIEPHLPRYEHSFREELDGPGPSFRLRWRRHLRIARDQSPAAHC